MLKICIRDIKQHTDGFIRKKTGLATTAADSLADVIEQKTHSQRLDPDSRRYYCYLCRISRKQRTHTLHGRTFMQMERKQRLRCFSSTKFSTHLIIKHKPMLVEKKTTLNIQLTNNRSVDTFPTKLS